MDIEPGQTVTALELLRAPAGRANPWYRERYAGGTTLATASGWVFTVVSVADCSWRHRATGASVVQLHVIADAAPDDWRTIPGWQYAEPAVPALPRSAEKVECTFAVDGATAFTRIPVAEDNEPATPLTGKR